ncbi:hypothetical protein M9H77_30197 [Catharanthus roseus]|uniref:Uncharacterized protein n=1 Tax=Catharanthus roseus TaxID=4058 RepID=A0ACB9ZXL0_CATRO|nr:hypothetical protein M9H77_30197 [Catharanthus roseus]
MKGKESLFEEHERMNEEKGSESAKQRHDKNSYSLKLKLDSFLNKEIFLLMNDYYSYVANVDYFVRGAENKEERMLGIFENIEKSLEKELLNLQEETTINFSLNPSPLYYV